MKGSNQIYEPDRFNGLRASLKFSPNQITKNERRLIRKSRKVDDSGHQLKSLLLQILLSQISRTFAAFKPGF